MTLVNPAVARAESFARDHGLQIPILKYQDRGKVNQDLVDVIRQNVRMPSRAIGDLRAQVTAVKTSERRFLELIGRYGREPVAAGSGGGVWKGVREAGGGRRSRRVGGRGRAALNQRARSRPPGPP